MIEKLIDQSISIDKIIGIDWYRSIDDQSITTQKSFIDWHRLEEDFKTDVTRATRPIIRYFVEALRTTRSSPCLLSANKEYNPLHVYSNYHLLVIAFPCHNVYARRLGRGFTEYKVQSQKLSSLPI